MMATLVRCVQVAEEYLDCALPDREVRVLLVPEHMLIGMENASLIYLNITAEFQAALVGGGKESDRVEGLLKRSLLHEVLHFWVGNSVGCSMAMKEGIVLWLENQLAGKVVTAPSLSASSSSSPPSVTGAGKRSQSGAQSTAGSATGGASAAAGKKKAAGASASPGGQATPAASPEDAGEESLHTLFRTSMNLNAYDQYQNAVDKIALSLGAQTVRQNLHELVCHYANSFVEDDVILQTLCRSAGMASAK
jgi:hypothetical protein